MSFSPLLDKSTFKLAVTGVAQDVPKHADWPGTSYNKSECLIQNAGPSTIFVARIVAGGTTEDAVVDDCMPVFPDTQLTTTVSQHANEKLSVISEGTATAYFTYGTGDLTGMSLSVAAG